MIEIKGFDGQGFQPLVSFETWSVSALRYLDEIAPDKNNSMERHLLTDEVFVLVRGIGMLVLGGNGDHPDGVQTINMTAGDVYNVKMNTWHTVVLSEDAHVILVENKNTNMENSEYCLLSLEMQETLQHNAKGFLNT
jgi:hypothetical protein